EQPIPESLTTFSGRIDKAHTASVMAAVTESWPQPAQSVDIAPSYSRRVRPSSFFGKLGCATLGLAMMLIRGTGGWGLGWKELSANCLQLSGRTDFGKYAVDDHRGRHRQAGVVQDRAQLRLVDGRFECQKTPELRIAVLLDDEDERVLSQELFDFLTERERADAHVVRVNAATFEQVQRLADRAIAASDRHDADVVRVAAFEDGARHELLRRLELALQSVDDDLILGRIFRIPAVLIVS